MRKAPVISGTSFCPEDQLTLARAAAATGKPVILILTEGRPRFITSIAPMMKGIVMAYWSGRKTAEAISDILAGDYNPDGRLPFSYPKSMGEMVLYDRKPTEDVREVFNDDRGAGYDPLFPFGWGLSYTQFEYSDLHLNSDKLNPTGKLTVSITVRNYRQPRWQTYRRTVYARTLRQHHAKHAKAEGVQKDHAESRRSHRQSPSRWTKTTWLLSTPNCIPSRSRAIST